MKLWDKKSETGLNRRSVLKRLGALTVFMGLPAPVWGVESGHLPNLLAQGGSQTTKMKEGNMPGKVIKSEEEWRRILTPEQFQVMRKKGTERAFSGQYHDFKGKGVYQCAACGLDLFSSETKFDSGTGWPSFWAPVSEQSVRTASDNSLFMRRTEVLCSRCDAHLGHVFDDGPPPRNFGTA